MHRCLPGEAVHYLLRLNAPLGGVTNCAIPPQRFSILLWGDDTVPIKKDTFNLQPSMKHHPTQIYQFRIREDLDDDLVTWFSPLTIAHEPNGVTSLTGPVRDQAELHGLLIKIHDLNLTLLSVINKCLPEKENYGTISSRLRRGETFGQRQPEDKNKRTTS